MRDDSYCRINSHPGTQEKDVMYMEGIVFCLFAVVIRIEECTQVYVLTIGRNK